jgi:hypothetical protein
MEKRTSIDWSKHELITKEDSLCKIHWLKIPETNTHNVKFIHVEGILIITGDFGRWSFCRDFNPEGYEKCGVSDSYWCEKIEMHSEQKTDVFDTETAENSINEKIKELQENNDPIDGDDEEITYNSETEELIEFWNDLLNYCNDEFELSTYFRDNKPNSLDFEDFPYCKKQNNSLDAIFDAFEEIIKRFSDCA